MNKKKRSIFFFIFPGFLLITLASLVALASLGWYVLQQYSQDNVHEQLHQQTGFLSGMLTSETLEDFKILSNKLRQSTDLRVTLIDTTGVVLYDSDSKADTMENHRFRPEVELALGGGDGYSIRYSNTLQREMFYLARRIDQVPEHNRVVLRLAMPVLVWRDGMRQISGPFATGFILIVLLAVILAYSISRRIIVQLNLLRNGAEAYATRVMRESLPDFSWSEFDSLAQSLHEMARQLHDRIHAALAQKNEREAILSSMAQALVAVDTAGIILWTNKRFERLFSGKIPVRKGRIRLLEVVRNSDIGAMLETIWDEEKTGMRDIRLDVNGERMIYRVRSAVMYGADEEISGAVFTFTDITRIHKLEEMRKEFVGNVSHELRTPITSIQGAVETLETLDVDDEEMRAKFLDMLKRHALRMNNIVSDLLTLSQLDTEDLSSMDSELMSLGELVNRALDQCLGLIEKQQFQVEVSGNTELQVLGKEGLLEQALVNLISNGVRYSEPEKKLLIRISQKDNFAVIEIQDQGWGISPDHQSRIFERFYRVDKARSRALGGTGLGLSLTRHILSMHKGSISLKSAPGEGSTFYVSLPLHD